MVQVYCDLKLIPFHPGFLGAWESLSPFLSQALERGGGNRDWSLDDIYQHAYQGHVQLWSMQTVDRFVGAGVTCDTHYPQRWVVEILLLGCEPNYGYPQQALKIFREMAKKRGAHSLVGTGRPGWAKFLGAEERRIFEVKL